jgi:hypothetical protein
MAKEIMALFPDGCRECRALTEGLFTAINIKTGTCVSKTFFFP